MKNICFLLVMIAGLMACDKDDNQSSNDPIDQLPEATQNGANTIGCLLNGEAFIPAGSEFSVPPLDCVYQYVDGGYCFNFQGNRRINGDLRGISISTKNLQLEDGGEYDLLNDEQGNANAARWYAEDFTFIYTSEEYTGKLNITKLNMSNQTV